MPHQQEGWHGKDFEKREKNIISSPRHPVCTVSNGMKPRWNRTEGLPFHLRRTHRIRCASLLSHESIPAAGRGAACSSRAPRLFLPRSLHLRLALGGTRRYLPPSRARCTSNTGEDPGSGTLEREPDERSRRLLHWVHSRWRRHLSSSATATSTGRGAILARICRQQQDKCPIPPRKPCSKFMVNLIFAFLIVCLLLVWMHQIDWKILVLCCCAMNKWSIFFQQWNRLVDDALLSN